MGSPRNKISIANVSLPADLAAEFEPAIQEGIQNNKKIAQQKLQDLLKQLDDLIPEIKDETVKQGLIAEKNALEGNNPFFSNLLHFLKKITLHF